MTIGDPDVAVLRDHDTGRAVEVFLVSARDTRFTERHHELAVGAELVDLMPKVFLEPRFPAYVAVSRAVGDPDEAFAIDEEAMREVHDALPEAPHELAVHVDLDDRVEGGFGAAVRATAIEDP